MSTVVDNPLHVVQIAATPVSLFGTDRVAAKAIYLELAKALHPDKYADVKERVAHERAFAKLTEMWSRYNAPPPSAKIGKWTVVAPMHKGGICDIYEVSHDGIHAVLKIARSAKDNDLVKRERAAIVKLHGGVEADKFGERVPRLVDKFTASGRECNVLTLDHGELSMEYVSRAFHTRGGIPFRHVVWMTSRVLGALGYAHENGVVHGAVLPHHVFVNPSTHGATLLDWTASSVLDDNNKTTKIPYINKRWESFYPPEVRRGRASTATDIYMVGMCALNAGGVDIPYRFRDMINAMTALSPNSRDAHGWDVLNKWQEVAKQVYGPPKFVELAIPVS